MTPALIKSALETAAEVAGVSVASLTAKRPRRSGPDLTARRLASVLLVREAGLSYTHAGRLLDADHTTVLHHVQTSGDMEEVYPLWERTVAHAASAFAERALS